MDHDTELLIVGAGIAGASLAAFLSQTRRVVLLEAESQPGYHSTGRSAAMFMESYGPPAVRALTRASRAFYDAPPPEFGGAPILTPRGVVYLAGPDQLDLLDAAYAEILPLNPGVRRLTRDELLAELPCLRPEAVAAGMSEPGAADIDVHALHQGYLRGLRQRGGEIRTHAEVTALQRGEEGWHITLGDGEVLRARAVVNAAGAWARAVAQWLGIDLPVFGKRRTVFHFTCPEALPGCPLLIDPSGIWLRPEGTGFIAGYAPPEDADPDDAPLDPEHAAFEEHVWPQLAERIPAFEALRLHSSWAGYYEMNAFDHNAILGQHPACDNLYFANGFSGHGLQQCPAVGRGLAELILTGRWQTLDLSPLAFQRLLDHRPLLERNVI